MCLAGVRRIVADYVERYNEVRLHATLRDVPSEARLWVQMRTIFAARDRKLEAAQAVRKPAANIDPRDRSIKEQANLRPKKTIHHE